MHTKILLFSIIFITAFSIFTTCHGEMDVHFLDVGQGDAAIIVCDGECMIIDGGPPHASQYIYWYISEKLDIPEVKYMIATHPHEDHIGGLSAALNAAIIDVILSPVLEWDSRQFSSMMKYADMQGTPLMIPEEGDIYQLGGATVAILSCWTDAWDTNCMSIVCRIDYDDVSFLFTGDAEDMLEYMMIDSGYDLTADVLKVAHHGSSTSSTEEFIQTVQPKYAVISCGEDNQYGHPRPEVLDRLGAAEIYRTDLDGTIIMRSDGDTITVETELPHHGVSH